MKLLEALAPFKQWLEERNLRHDSLTIILNFADRKEAAAFDAAQSAELFRILSYAQRPRELASGRCKMLGIKIKIESPVHGPDR